MNQGICAITSVLLVPLLAGSLPTMCGCVYLCEYT